MGGGELASGRQSRGPARGESAVAGKGDHLQAAWDVIKWIGTPENIKDSYIVGLGLLPNREDTAADPRWAHSSTLKVAKDQLAVAMPRSVYGASYGQISEQVWTMEQKVLSGSSSAEQAAKEAGAAIKPLLGK